MKPRAALILAILAIVMITYAVIRIDDRCGYSDGTPWNADPTTAILIDDDGHPEGMRRLMTICDTLGIRCCFAIITDETENFEFYDSCRRAGHTLLSHSLHHATYADPYREEFSQRLLEEDLDSARKTIAHLGGRTDALVYPGNCGKDTRSRHSAQKYHRLCFAGTFLPFDYFFAPRTHRIPRYFLDGTSGFESFQRHVEGCQRRNFPIVLGIHSYDQRAWDSAYVAKCLTHLMEEGYNLNAKW